MFGGKVIQENIMYEGLKLERAEGIQWAMGVSLSGTAKMGWAEGAGEAVVIIGGNASEFRQGRAT